MFDPAAASARMNPGDKLNVSFHKAKPEPGGGSFVDNAQKAGMIPGGPQAAMPAGPSAHMPQMMAMSHPAVPDHRALLMAHLRRRMMGR